MAGVPFFFVSFFFSLVLYYGGLHCISTAQRTGEAASAFGLVHRRTGAVSEFVFFLVARWPSIGVCPLFFLYPPFRLASCRIRSTGRHLRSDCTFSLRLLYTKGSGFSKEDCSNSHGRASSFTSMELVVLWAQVVTWTVKEGSRLAFIAPLARFGKINIWRESSSVNGCLIWSRPRTTPNRKWCTTARRTVASTLSDKTGFGHRKNDNLQESTGFYHGMGVLKFWGFLGAVALSSALPISHAFRIRDSCVLRSRKSGSKRQLGSTVLHFASWTAGQAFFRSFDFFFYSWNLFTYGRDC